MRSLSPIGGLSGSEFELVNLCHENLDIIKEKNPALVIIDSSNADLIDEVNFSKSIRISEHEINPDADIFVPAGFPARETLKTLQFAIEQYQLKAQAVNMQNTLEIEQQRLKQLTDIGIALSQEKNLGKLLKKILDESQELSNCDAVSLFLVNRENSEQHELVFKLAQNTSIKNLNFEEKHFPNHL